MENTAGISVSLLDAGAFKSELDVLGSEGEGAIEEGEFGDSTLKEGHSKVKDVLAGSIGSIQEIFNLGITF